MFENRVLRRIFGSKRDEVTGKWRQLHKEELRKLCSLPSKIRIIKSKRMRWAGHIARMERRRMHVGFWWENQKEKQLGKPRRRWVDNIRMNVGGVGWNDVNWIGLAQDRNRWRAHVNSVLSLRVP
jgi:hypothetical protein